MLKFEWNALRAGHRVAVHDPASAEMTLVTGVVVMIDVHVGRKGANGVGIRVTDRDGPSRILWPSYLAVHHDPPDDPTEPCWRCQELADRTAAAPPQRANADGRQTERPAPGPLALATGSTRFDLVRVGHHGAH